MVLRIYGIAYVRDYYLLKKNDVPGIHMEEKDVEQLGLVVSESFLYGEFDV